MGMNIPALTTLLFLVILVVAVDVKPVLSHDPSHITWRDLKLGVGIKNRVSLMRDDVYRNKRRIIVVDQRGRGDSLTVQEAIDMVPHNNSKRVKIYILPGIYREKVFIPKSKPYISLIGDVNKAAQTVITWHNKASDKDKNGRPMGTFASATMSVEAEYFVASGITIENSIVSVPGAEGWQAVAFKITGDKAMFYRVRFIGTQDTLLDQSGSHYFYQCYIQGTVDFICGNGKSLYEDCVLHTIAKGYGAVAAQHRSSPKEDTGFSFVNCKLRGTGEIFLGRAWGEYSRVVYSYCDLDGIVRPKGWDDWRSPSRDKTTMFGEYQCRGHGANRAGRVPWSKALNHTEAQPFLDRSFINGEQWLRL